MKTVLRVAALAAAVWSASAHAYVERRWVARFDALGGGIGFAKQVFVDAGGSPRIVGTYGPNWPGDGLLAARYDGDGNLLWQVVLPGRSFGTEGVWSGGSRAASLDAAGVLSVPDTGGRLLRISADGVILADLDLAGVFGTPVGAVATAAAPDGGLIVAGTVASAAGPGDVVVAKLDAATLAPAWTRAFDRGGDDALRRLVVGARGEVFVAATSDGALSIWTLDAAGAPRLDVAGPVMYVWGFDVDAAGGMVAVGSDGTGGFTTVRYGADGALRWTAVAAPYRGVSGGVRVAPDGSVYVGGLSSGNYDLTKYAPDGTFAWERMYGDGWGDSEIYDLALDRGEPIVTGEFGYCSDRIRTMKHSAAGDLLWDAALLLPASSCASLNYGYSIAVDHGNVYVAGDSVDASVGGGWKPTLIKYAQVDVTAPVTAAAIAGTAGANGWYTSGVAVTLTATDPVADASGVRELRWSLDGGAEVVVPGDAAAVTLTTDGGHTLAFHAVDAAGNAEQPQSLVLALDATAPAPALTLSGTAGNVGWFRSAVGVTCSATDATSGLATLEYTGGGEAQTRAADGSIQGTLGDGTWPLTCSATDVAGNAGVKTALVMVDTTPPSVTVAVSPTTIKNNNKAVPVTVKITASDPGPQASKLATVVTTVTDRYGKVVPTSFDATGGVVNLTATKGQVYTVTVTATDVAGNPAQASAKVTVQ